MYVTRHFFGYVWSDQVISELSIKVELIIKFESFNANDTTYIKNTLQYIYLV